VRSTTDWAKQNRKWQKRNKFKPKSDKTRRGGCYPPCNVFDQAREKQVVRTSRRESSYGWEKESRKKFDATDKSESVGHPLSENVESVAVGDS